MLTTPVFLTLLAVLAIGAILLAGCTEKKQKPSAPESFVTHPDWSKNAIIYEVNVRQFTPEGTFQAFKEHLPRLKELGVDIIWLMPIYPIGEKNRKGTLGSYYSIQDYTAVNPEFGTMEDFKEVVDEAHELGMYVILDWVANHTAWDHAWIDEHPDWYTKDSTGKMIAPFDWTDVAELNYDNEELQKEMIEEMKFWITEADVDGFRCDVAMEVPTPFWNRAREELDAVKPVFMLAEAESPEHHDYAFDMSYAWELHHIMNGIAKGEKNANHLSSYFAKQDTTFAKDAYRMTFITNHDENSWNGTEYERMGDAVNTFAMLTYTLPGMPMIYSGQEAAFNERLEFFEKDTIDWGDYALEGFYRDLAKLRKDNPALWSGESGGCMERLSTSSDTTIFAFQRRKDNNVVIVIANLSAQPAVFSTRFKNDDMELTEWPLGMPYEYHRKEMFSLKPWEYRIFVGKISE